MHGHQLHVSKSALYMRRKSNQHLLHSHNITITLPHLYHLHTLPIPSYIITLLLYPHTLPSLHTLILSSPPHLHSLLLTPPHSSPSPSSPHPHTLTFSPHPHTLTFSSTLILVVSCSPEVLWELWRASLSPSSWPTFCCNTEICE